MLKSLDNIIRAFSSFSWILPRFSQLSEDRIGKIETILEMGNDIDLWYLELPDKEKKIGTDKKEKRITERLGLVSSNSITLKPQEIGQATYTATAPECDEATTVIQELVKQKGIQFQTDKNKMF